MFGHDASDDTCGFLPEWISRFETGRKSETGCTSRVDQIVIDFLLQTERENEKLEKDK